IEDRIRSINRQNYQELDNDTEIFNITCFHYFQYLNYIDNQLNSIQKLNGGYKEILKEEDITEYFLTIFVNFDHHEFQSCCYTTYVSQIINNPNKITKQDANFIFDLAKRLVLPKEYKLLEKIINSVKSENRLLLEANTRFTFFSYQVAISLIVDTENGFVLRRQILADQYLDEFLRKKLMDQFDEKIIPICLNIEQDQPTITKTNQQEI
ncbi:3030_t:CDS:2, partial [Gigaspora rosea]